MNEIFEGALLDLNTSTIRPGHILIQRTAGAIFFIGMGSQSGRFQRYAFDVMPNLSDRISERCQKKRIELTAADFAAMADRWASQAVLELGEDTARRLMAAEALVKDGFDPDEARVPAGTPDGGQWTAGEGGSASGGDSDNGNDSEQAPVRLPPGDRIDELGDLLEWIANARREDEPAIRAEIKRVYYDAGDVRGGNALNQALSSIVNIDASPDRSDREAVLEDYEKYTREDPAEVGEFARDLVTGVLLLPLLPRAILPEPNIPLAVAPTVEAPNVWKLGWGDRGRQIEAALGNNLPSNFPVIDRYADGVFTSIKSLDLNAATYQDAGRLASRINTYIKALAEFDGAILETQSTEVGDITGKVLKIAVPKNSITEIQQATIDTARTRARSFGIDLIIVPF